MRTKVVKCWLAIIAFVLLMPLLSAAEESDGKKGCEPSHQKCKVAADEGGGAAAYLLGVGLTCLGGVFVSSRLRRLP